MKLREYLDAVRDGPARLAMSARLHAVMAGREADSVSRVLHASGWTCARCGTVLPEMLEAAGGPHEGQPWQACCQFCHNLDHPVWAASAGRLEGIVLSGAGRLRQCDISRMSWAALACRSGPEKSGQDAGQEQDAEGTPPGAALPSRAALTLLASLEQGRAAFRDLYGTSADAFLEILQMTSDRIPARIVGFLDDSVRLVPAALFPDCPPSGRVSCWNGLDFTDMTEEAVLAWRRGQRPEDTSSDRIAFIRRRSRSG